MRPLTGTLYDGKSSKGQVAIITADSSVNAGSSRCIIYLEVEGNKQLIPADSIRISSRLGQTARYIVIDGFGKFETTQNQQVDFFESLIHPKKNNGILYKLESNLPLIGLATIVTIAFVWSLVKWGIPAAGDYIAGKLPEQTGSFIEKTIITQLEKDWFTESELPTERQDEIYALFDSVKSKLGHESDDYIFKIRNAEDSIGANALAFPNGTIIMTDQLIKLVKSDKQIAGVLAHEIGHLSHNHSLRQLVRGSLLTFAIAWVSGDVSGASSLVITAPALLTQLSYSREFEHEADRYAIKYFNCDKEGLDSMANFFSIMMKSHTAINNDDNTSDKDSIDTIESEDQTNKLNKLLEYVSSHPAGDKRSGTFLNHYIQNCQ